MAFAYVVRCTFDDTRARDGFVAWLRAVHVRDVCASGAEQGEIVVLDDSVAVEIRYRFASRDAFDAYVRDHAAARRAEGLAELARLGGRAWFDRWTGEIAGAVTRTRAT